MGAKRYHGSHIDGLTIILSADARGTTSREGHQNGYAFAANNRDTAEWYMCEAVKHANLDPMDDPGVIYEVEPLGPELRDDEDPEMKGDPPAKGSYRCAEGYQVIRRVW